MAGEGEDIPGSPTGRTLLPMSSVLLLHRNLLRAVLQSPLDIFLWPLGKLMLPSPQFLQRIKCT